MTPPITPARSKLTELKTALRELEGNLSDHEHRIAELQSRIGNGDDVEAELQQLDIAEAEAFHVAAKSEDPAALDAVKVDAKKRADLQKQLAVHRARRSGVEKVIAEVQTLQQSSLMGRNAARAAVPVFEMLVLIDEMVPVIVKSAIEAARNAEASFSTLNQIYGTLVTVAHAQPEGGQYRTQLHCRLGWPFYRRKNYPDRHHELNSPFGCYNLGRLQRGWSQPSNVIPRRISGLLGNRPAPLRIATSGEP